MNSWGLRREIIQYWEIDIIFISILERLISRYRKQGEEAQTMMKFLTPSQADQMAL